MLVLRPPQNEKMSAEFAKVEFAKRVKGAAAKINNVCKREEMMEVAEALAEKSRSSVAQSVCNIGHVPV